MKGSVFWQAQFLRALVLWCCFAFLAGCAGWHPQAPQTAEVENEPEYLIGPGDNLNILVWRNPELSMSLPVRPDGQVTTPLVEDLQAAGKTPTALARDIEEELSHFIRDPVVSVIVTGFAGPYDQQVRVVGQAAEPQALQFREHMTLIDVMIAVGGLTEFAAGNRARLLRWEDGERNTYRVRLDDLMNGGDVSANVELLPGDVLIVPERFF